jgi:two-component system response regulator HydG
MTNILLIEDDRTFSRILEGFLSKNKYAVIPCFGGQEGLKSFFSKTFDLVLLDYRLPDTNGLEVLSKMKQSAPEVPIIIMTSFSDVATAVKAIKAGAFEYITKPVNPDELLMVMEKALSKDKDTSSSEQPGVMDFVEGQSDSSRKMHEHIKLVAPTELSIIIEGESGTGKEYVAGSIHRFSKRNGKPFIAVDCGVLSKELAASELFGHVKGSFTGAVADKKGQFEVASGGTLFLDEVGNLSYEVQMKLLRAIQERTVQPLGSNKEIKVDVRIITATNEDLHERVKQGYFREDLYHRLNEFKILVPPLRSRIADLVEFAEFFRKNANLELKRNTSAFDHRVMEILKSYQWPGNLREMKNIIKRAVLLSQGDTVSMDTLPGELIEAVQRPVVKNGAPIYDLKILQETQERELIMKTLHEVRFNKSKAARILNIDRKTLYLKMERYGLK